MQMTKSFGHFAIWYVHKIIKFYSKNYFIHNYGAPQNYHNMQEPVVDSSKGNVAISQFSTQK